MKKQISLVFCLLFFSFGCFSQRIANDNNKANQWKSMVYKQWKFTPDWYYYQWYKKKIGVIKVWLPGLGLHQSYINKYNKNINQMTPMIASNKVNELQMESAMKANKKVYEKEIKLYADRTIDYEYLLRKDDINEIKRLILKEVAMFDKNDVSSENIEALYGEYDRINNSVDIIRNGHLSNAERREAYLAFEQDYKNLLSCCKRLNSICKLVNNK